MRLSLLLVTILILAACGCASNKVYVDSLKVQGLGAVVRFPAGSIVPINLKRVISGSLIELTNNELASYIGLYVPDINTIPEYARRLNEDLVMDSDIRLEFDSLERDVKGRLLVYVFMADARLVNAEIIRAGLAKALIVPPNQKYKQELLAAEEDARKNKRGIWSDDFNAK